MLIGSKRLLGPQRPLSPSPLHPIVCIFSLNAVPVTVIMPVMGDDHGIKGGRVPKERQDCREKAERAKNSFDKEHWLKMAEHWLKMAAAEDAATKDR
jgi:hypothetical protein